MKRYFSLSKYQDICDLYNLGSIKKVNYFKTGFRSAKAALTTSKGIFVVTRDAKSNDTYWYKTKESLAVEPFLLASLKDLPVPEYVKNDANEYILETDHSFVTVYRYIRGTAATNLNCKQFATFARFIAEFHKQGARLNLDLSQRTRYYHLPAEIVERMAVTALRQRHPELRDVFASVKKGVLSNHPSQNLPHGPIHVDWKPEHLLFVGDKLTGVLDFGNVYHGPLMLDIGKAIMYNCCKNGSFDKDMADLLWRTYCKHRQPTPQERAYFLKSIAYAIYSHIWCDLYHVPLKYVPERYTLSLVRNLLPVARKLSATRT